MFELFKDSDLLTEQEPIITPATDYELKDGKGAKDDEIEPCDD